MSRLFDNANTQALTRAAILTAYPFTVAAWIYPDELGIDQTFFSLSDTATDTEWWRMELTTGNVLAAHTRSGGTNERANSTGTVSINTWAHGCGVFASATDRTCYRDGGNTGTSVTSLTPGGIDTTDIARHTVNSGATFFFSGRIAEVGIWNVALNAQEVAALARGFSPLLIRPASLVAYYPLMRGDNNGSSHFDRWKSSLHVTETGTGSPAVADHKPMIFPVGVP